MRRLDIARTRRPHRQSPCREDEREGVTPEHGRPSPHEQMPRSARMHRSARPPLVVHHQDHRHLVPSFRTPLARGRVPLVRVWERSLCPTHWLSTPSAC
jgi:hypothetical protein